MEFLPFVSLTHPVYTLTAQEIRVPRPLVNPSSFLLLPCLVPEEVQVAIPRSPVYGARSHMDPQCRGGVLGWGGNRLQFRMRRRLPRKWSTRLCKDWHRSWELKPPPLNVGTGAAFDILNLRQKENIEEGECAGKKKKADVIWKDPVCGNHPKIWLNAYCVLGPVLRPMRKQEWIRQKPCAQVEWKTDCTYSSLWFHRHTKRDRNTEQEIQGKKFHYFLYQVSWRCQLSEVLQDWAFPVEGIWEPGLEVAELCGVCVENY